MAALPLALLATGFAVWNAVARRADELHGMSREAESLRLDVERELAATVSVLQALATSPTVDSALAAGPGGEGIKGFHQQARTLADARPATFHNIVLDALDSQQIVNTLTAPEQPLPTAAAAHPPPKAVSAPDPLAEWQRMLDRVLTRQPYFSQLFWAPDARRYLLSVAMPVVRDDTVVAVVAANLLPASISAVLGAQPLPAGWTAGVVDAQHVIIARSREADRFIGDLTGDQVAAFQDGTAPASMIEAQTLAGETVYTALRRSPLSGWTVALFAPKAAVNAPVLDAVTLTGGLGAFVVGMVVIGGWLLGRGLGREISGLGESAAALAHPTPALPEAWRAEQPRVREVALVRDAFASAIAALRESEARATTILDSISDGFYALDRDWRFTYVNRRAQTLSGTQAADLLGRPLLDVFPQLRDTPLHRQLRQAMASREPTRFEAFAVVTRGWVAGSIYPQDDGGVAVYVRDVSQRKQAEAQLREAQEERERLLRTLDLAAVMVRDMNGTIRFWSQGCARLYGWAPEEVVGRAAHPLLRTTFPVPQEEIDAALARDGEWVGTLRQTTRAGTEVIVTTRKVLHRDADGQPVAILDNVTDLTALHRAEIVLREREARLRLAVDVAQLGVWEWDLRDGSAKFGQRISQISGGVVPADTWMGRGSAELRAWLDNVHPEDRSVRRRALADLLGGRSDVYDARFRVRGPDGKWIWVAVRGAIIGPTEPWRIVGVLQDITAQKDAEAALERLVLTRTAALAEAEARFRAIFDAQFQFIGLLTRDGTTLEANRASLEAGGLTREDVVGRPFWDAGWWPRTERDWLRDAVADAARGVFVRREMEMRGADGHAICLDFSLKPVRDPATGAVEFIIPEGRDLTERRDLEAQLAQAQKTQALGQLAGGIAHDFNNILQSVTGAAAMIERHPDDLDRSRRLARVALDAAQRGASITQRLLSFARRGGLRAEAVDTADLLRNMREVLAHTLGSPIAVRSVVEPDTPPLFADRGQLETALVNLGTNARDAMPRGGTLTLSAAPDAVSADDEHPAGIAAGTYVRLTISDSGEGMSAETIARVTEPFFTTKPEGKGTGLGLTMVQHFAEQSGGGMTIDSTPGAGTAVTVWLPSAACAAPADAGGAALPETRAAASVSVLLVDDDDLVRETLADQLQDMGFTTLVASSGQEAIARLDAGEAIDVLVSDLSMPCMNGIETIHQARLRRPALLCFLLTGYMGERATLASEDAFVLLRKPVPARVLAAQIEARLTTTG